MQPYLLFILQILGCHIHFKTIMVLILQSYITAQQQQVPVAQVQPAQVQVRQVQVQVRQVQVRPVQVQAQPVQAHQHQQARRALVVVRARAQQRLKGVYCGGI